MFALAILVALPAHRAPACSIGPDYRWPSLAEQVSAADLILEGSVVSEVPAPDSIRHLFENLFLGGVSVTLTVHRWLKGTGPAEVTVRFGEASLCNAPIPKGRAILFLVGDPVAGTLALNYLGLFDAAIESNEGTIDRVVRLVERGGAGVGRKTLFTGPEN